MKKRTVAPKAKQEQPNPFKSFDDPVTIAISLIDTLIERIRTNKLKKFEDGHLVQLRKLNAKQLVELNQKCHTTFDDISGALSKDAYCMEAYSHYSKEQLKLVLEFLKALKALKPDKNASGKIRQATERKKKKQSPEVIVKKILYLPMDAETNMTSLHPKEFVGAAELWIYNTKTRKLGCYHAKNDSGLSAKGTTILGYDEDRSTTKTIRKPAEQLRDFMSGGKRYWEKIKAVPQQISPRMNRETIILRVAQST